VLIFPENSSQICLPMWFRTNLKAGSACLVTISWITGIEITRENNRLDIVFDRDLCSTVLIWAKDHRIFLKADPDLAPYKELMFMHITVFVNLEQLSNIFLCFGSRVAVVSVGFCDVMWTHPTQCSGIML